MADQPISGKVVLITGAARNLGEELSHTFAQAGAAVAVNTRSNIDQAERVVQSIRNRAGEAMAVRADVYESSSPRFRAAPVTKTTFPDMC